MHRLAWTITDLDRVDAPGFTQLDTALRLRLACPCSTPASGGGLPDDRRRRSGPPGQGCFGTLGEPGDPRLVSLVAELGAVVVRDRLAAGRESGDRMLDDIATRLASADPVRDLERAQRLGIRFVVPGDDEWPHRVDQLSRRRRSTSAADLPSGCGCAARCVSTSCNRPWPSWARGRPPATATTVAGEIAAVVARAGYPVVSGAAFGIDQAAHRGALAAGDAVAVLACGVDRAYPTAHRPLLDHLAETCAVVSELAPGRAPSGSGS